MLRIISIILILFFQWPDCLGQNTGLLKIDQPQNIEFLMMKWKEQNILKNSMDGYRIQLSFGNDRVKANRLRSEFLLSFPDVPAYLIYQQPYYKVRVGDCKDRLCALRIQENISKLYPNTYIVRDLIPLQ